jgi:hypothetical protein
MFSQGLYPGMFYGPVEPVLEEFAAVNPDDSEMLNPDDSPAVNPE